MAQHCTTTTTARPVEMMMVIIIILLWVVKGHKKDFRSLARRLSRFSFFSVTISVVVVAAAAAVVWSLTDWPWRYAAPSSIKVLTTFSLRSRWQTHVICPMQAGRQAGSSRILCCCTVLFLSDKRSRQMYAIEKRKKRTFYAARHVERTRNFCPVAMMIIDAQIPLFCRRFLLL